MNKDTVIIGCKAPSGFILEGGYKLTGTGKMERGSDYFRIEIKGWHAHTAQARASGIQVPAGVNMRPFLNRNVPRTHWDAWKAEHKNSWLLKNEILFEAKDEASAQMRVLESDKTPTVLAPVNKDKPIVPNISQADFAKKPAAEPETEETE